MAAWAFYDAANNGFATPVQTFIFPAYFAKAVAADPTAGTALWGNMVGLSSLAIALGGPVLGAAADRMGRRKPWLLAFTLLCVAATLGLWFVQPDQTYVALALGFAALGIIGSEYSQIFYNAMLPDLVPSSYMGRWSGWGWAAGYVGGLGCLLSCLFLLVGENALITLPRESAMHVRATCLLSGAWYLLFAAPLFLFTPDAPATGAKLRESVRQGLAQLRGSLRNVRRYAHIVRFLIARMLYNDGLTTTFAFGGIFAAGAFGMSESQVLLFGVALNITAGLGAAAMAWVDDWIGPKPTILLSLVGLLIPGAVMLATHSETVFWIAGCVLGLFVGPVQSASRSYLARTAPEELRNQFFGLFAMSGKLTSFAGPLLVGWVTWLAGSQRIGMSVVLALFLLGGAVLLTVPRAAKMEE